MSFLTNYIFVFNLNFFDMDNHEIINFENLTLDISARKFLVNKVPISLRNKEFTLMEYFMKNMGRVLTRTQILEEVWDHNIFCPTNTVDVHVSSLRKKLRCSSAANFIKTIYCVGYMLEV